MPASCQDTPDIQQETNIVDDPCYTQKMLGVDEAIDYLLSKTEIRVSTELVDTLEARGRVLSSPQSSSVNVPPVDNSAMDGYAVAAADCASQPETVLPVTLRVAAGDPPGELAPGTAARIFTGASIPKNADAVVMQEQCEQQSANVVIRHQPVSGENVRRAGEDIRQGDKILQAGQRLRPQDLGLAASVGLAKLPVYKKLRVAIFSTGDELVMPGNELHEGQIYNSNRFTLTGLLQGIGCEIIDLGCVEDTLAATVDALKQAAESADVIITSGGVSVGEEDYIKKAIDELGQVDMWRVAMKPGKPIVYATVNGTPFLGLPGNPVSVFVTFCLFARPCLLKSQGVIDVLQKPLPVTAGFDWPRPGVRREFVRARLASTGDDNATEAVIYPHQGSGVLTSTVWAEGLVIVPENKTIMRGDRVAYLSFNDLLN